MIIAQSGTISLTQADIEYGIFGDPIVLLDRNSESATMTFGEDRIFKPRMNTRLSAVYYYRRISEKSKFRYKRAVYHNPYAEIPLSQELFRDENVKQLIPVGTTDKYIRMEWIED